jgi:hypothetical protein
MPDRLEFLGPLTPSYRRTATHWNNGSVTGCATDDDRELVMKRIKIDLENCYGIKKLQKELDFSNARAYALYAPNGVMKSSLARTFQDAADGVESKDRIFPSRKTSRGIVDENNTEITGERILVVLPYSEQFGVTEKTSTLLVDPKLRKEFDEILRATDQAKEALLSAVQAQSQSKRNSRECRVLSCCDAEHLHGVKVLILPDEFRDGSLFAVIQETFGQRVSQRAGNDELGWWNSGSDGSQPGAERVPDLGWSDGC